MSDFRSRDTGPRERFGLAFERGEYPTQAGYLTSFWSAAGRSWANAVEDVLARWSALGDINAELLSEPQFREIVEDRNIPYNPWVTRAQAQRLVSEYDYLQVTAQYESRPVAELVGAVLPYAMDPVTAATYFTGVGAMTRAAQAATLKQFLRHSLTAGAQIGAATLPAEAAAQVLTYGEVRPDELAMVAGIPLVAAPVLSGASRAFARGPTAAGPTRTIPSEAPPPPVPKVDITPEVPAVRVAETFSDYPGGVRQWLSELASGQEGARTFAARVGVDPDAAPLRSLIQQQARLTAQRTAAPAEVRLRQLQGFTLAARRQATEATEAAVRAERGALEVERAQAALAKRETGELLDTWEAAAGRRVDRAEAEMAELLDLPEFAQVRDALNTPAPLRSAEQRIAYKEFVDHGPEGLTARYVNALEREYARTADEAGRLARELSEHQGGKPKELRAALREANRRRSALAAQIEAASARLSRVDAEVPIEDLMAALDASRLESPLPPPAALEAPTGNPTQALIGDDAGMEAFLAAARRMGADLDSADELVAEIRKAALECGL